jgi:competence protein ComEC
MKIDRIPVIRALIILAGIAFAARLVWPDDRLTVTVFDVGQGDAILVQCGTRQLLVDGGPDESVMPKLGAAMPFFDRTIETVVLTHPSADEYVGLVGVLRNYRVGRMFTSGFAASGPDYQALLEAERDAHVTPTTVKPGDRIAIGDCGHADVYWPDRTQGGISRNDTGADSIVLRVSRDDATSSHAAVMLMGDANADVERALLAAKVPLAADVLKVGHHGSADASSSDFIDAVHPSFAAISVGVKNKFGQPAPIILRRLEVAGARTLRTDKDGDIKIIVAAGRAYVD